jgi:hypothetical protein
LKKIKNEERGKENINNPDDILLPPLHIPHDWTLKKKLKDEERGEENANSLKKPLAAILYSM